MGIVPSMQNDERMTIAPKAQFMDVDGIAFTERIFQTIKVERGEKTFEELILSPGSKVEIATREGLTTLGMGNTIAVVEPSMAYHEYFKDMIPALKIYIMASVDPTLNKLDSREFKIQRPNEIIFPLENENFAVIGRNPDYIRYRYGREHPYGAKYITIFDDRTCSREHASIQFSGVDSQTGNYHFIVEDRNSTNGTIVGIET